VKKSALVLTVAGDTIEEIRMKLLVICGEFGITATTTITEAPALTPASAPTSNKRGRKPKEETAAVAAVAPAVLSQQQAAAPAEADIFSDAPAVAASTSSVTREDLNRAVLAVQHKKGLNAARGVIAKFGAKRISELKETDFPKVVQACNESLASA
jgi:hypothetical protein